MSESPTAGLCRLTIRAPEKQLDLAVPPDIPIADLLPVFADHAGEDLDEAGLEHGGWSLQRIGGEPLPLEESPGSLDLKDGEVLLLRPRTAALPPIRYDNLVDAVAGTVQSLPHAWSPTVSRWVLRAVAGAALAGCLLLLAVHGAGDVSRGALAAGAALVALAGAGTAARAMDDHLGALLLSGALCLFLGLGGVVVVSGHLTGLTVLQARGVMLLTASAAAAVGAGLALGVVGAYREVFAGVLTFAAGCALGGLLMLGLDLPFSRAAAGVATLALIFSGFVPMLSFSLAGLRLPALPTNVEQLQEGIAPHSGEEISERATATDRLMSGFYLAVGALCLLCLAGLTHHPDLPRGLTAALLALLLVLHGRGLGTAWQRLGLTIPAGLGVVLLLVELALGLGGNGRLAVTACLLLCAALLTAMSWIVPGRRLLPHWGRAGDILQTATAVALLPAVLWALGVYHFFRALTG